jgi:hypothetical protein
MPTKTKTAAKPKMGPLESKLRRRKDEDFFDWQRRRGAARRQDAFNKRSEAAKRGAATRAARKAKAKAEYLASPDIAEVRESIKIVPNGTLIRGRGIERPREADANYYQGEVSGYKDGEYIIEGFPVRADGTRFPPASDIPSRYFIWDRPITIVNEATINTLPAREPRYGDLLRGTDGSTTYQGTYRRTTSGDTDYVVSGYEVDGGNVISPTNRPSDYYIEAQSARFIEPDRDAKVAGIGFGSDSARYVGGFKRFNLSNNEVAIIEVGGLEQRIKKNTIELVDEYPPIVATPAPKSYFGDSVTPFSVPAVSSNSEFTINFSVSEPAKLPDELERLLPVDVADVVRDEVTRLQPMHDTMMNMAGRFGRGTVAATLATIAADPVARANVDKAMKDEFLKNFVPSVRPAEIIVGGGVHAAIYSAVRYQKMIESGADPDKYVRPVVLERNSYPGGIFAVADSPAFWLNSRNRPGPLGTPGDQDGALNFLPGAMLQLSEMPGGEYQTNADMAWLIRLQLTMYANVIPNIAVDRVTSDTASAAVRYTVQNDDNKNQNLKCDRVIVATGLGDERKFDVTSDRYMTFAAFMGRMDKPNLGGLGRVAVIGAGDSGKVTVEALIGQSPHMDIAALETPMKIDWYSDEIPDSPERWAECNRTRYKAIGPFIGRKITPREERVAYVTGGYEAVYVNGTRYDHVIDCRGFSNVELYGGIVRKSMDGRFVALESSSGYPIYTIGPAADLALEASESKLSKIAENVTSIFRYADRTAALAMSFPVAKSDDDLEGDQPATADPYRVRKGDRIRAITNRASKTTVEGIAKRDADFGFEDQFSIIELTDDKGDTRSAFGQGAILLKAKDTDYRVRQGDRIRAFTNRGTDETIIGIAMEDAPEPETPYSIIKIRNDDFANGYPVFSQDAVLLPATEIFAKDELITGKDYYIPEITRTGVVFDNKFATASNLAGAVAYYSIDGGTAYIKTADATRVTFDEDTLGIGSVITGPWSLDARVTVTGKIEGSLFGDSWNVRIDSYYGPTQPEFFIGSTQSVDKGQARAAFQIGDFISGSWCKNDNVILVGELISDEPDAYKIRVESSSLIDPSLSTSATSAFTKGQLRIVKKQGARMVEPLPKLKNKPNGLGGVYSSKSPTFTTLT